MKDEHDPLPTTEAPEPLDVMRKVTECLFRSIFHAVTSTADVTFPYLTSVPLGSNDPGVFRRPSRGRHRGIPG